VELSDGIHAQSQEVLVAHANAALTPRARLKLARLIVEHDVPISQAAARFQVAWPTAKRWLSATGPCGVPEVGLGL
jgi:hypothetical protein